jgi:hypothetical protein
LVEVFVEVLALVLSAIATPPTTNAKAAAAAAAAHLIEAMKACWVCAKRPAGSNRRSQS